MGILGPKLLPEIEESIRKEQEEKIREFANKIKNQKPIPPEFVKTVDKHFWELA
ncbi:MAG: hypothetical protein ACOCQD_00620 [archaeon]